MTSVEKSPHNISFHQTQASRGETVAAKPLQSQAIIKEREKKKKGKSITFFPLSIFLSPATPSLFLPVRPIPPLTTPLAILSVSFSLRKKNIFILNKIKQKNNPSLSVLQRPDTSLLHTEVFFASLIILVSVLQKRYGC